MYRHFGAALPSREQIRVFLEQLCAGNIPPAPRAAKDGAHNGTKVSASPAAGPETDRPAVHAPEPVALSAPSSEISAPAPSVAAQTQPVAQRPAVPPAGVSASLRGGGATRSAFSLTSLLSQGRGSQNKAGHPDGEPSGELQEPVCQEDLVKTWERLCQAVGGEKRIGLHTAMNAADVRLEGASVIGITVSSAAAAHELEENMLELLGRIRAALHNTALTHRIAVDQSIREHLPYTPREKYEYLRSKNPLIEKMRHDLDLNIDF